MDEVTKRCQVARACMPRNTEMACKHGIFINVLTLAFRMYMIYRLVPKFCTRQSIFKIDIHSELPGTWNTGIFPRTFFDQSTNI